MARKPCSKCGNAQAVRPGGLCNKCFAAANSEQRPVQNIQQIACELVKTDGGTQTRVAVDDARVTEYAEEMGRGAEFPPVVVFHDGVTYWLADGFHRLLAKRRNSNVDITADVRVGGKADALLYALSANAEHGLPRTPADKRNCVRIVLLDPSWCKWNDSEIADRCKVTRWLVMQVRNDMEARKEIDRTTERTYVNAAGEEVTRPVHRPGTKPAGGVSADTPRHGDGEDAPILEQPTVVASKPVPATKPPAVLRDGIGLPVPNRLESVFRDAMDLFDRAHDDFRGLARLLNQIATAPGGEVLRRNLKMLTRDGVEHFRCTDLHNSLMRLENGKPFVAECPYCHDSHPGRYVESCRACHGLGWVTEDVWDRTPKEMKAALLALAKEGAA